MIYIERRKTSNDVKQIKNIHKNLRIIFLFQVHNLITNNKMRCLIILANKDDLIYQCTTLFTYKKNTILFLNFIHIFEKKFLDM